jgi:excisionase family DNA binding protein
VTTADDRGCVERKFLTLAQFSQRYQVSRSTIYRLAHRRAISIVKFGSSSRISTDQAEAWAAALPVMGEDA